MNKFAKGLGFIILAWLPWFLAVSWDSGVFEASPGDNDLVSQGAGKIRQTKTEVRDRAEVEHLWGTITAGGDTGRSREGSARAFYETADPSALANSVTDTLGSGALDEGRLLFRSDTGEAKIHSGSAWVQLVQRLSGTVGLIGTPLFGAVSAGTLVDTYDPREFTIRSVGIDTTTDADCADGGNISSTNLAAQVFGTAGIACYSVSLNLSARSTTNSRALVLAQFNNDAVAGACSGTAVTYTVYRDSTANQVGQILNNPGQNSGIKSSNPMLIAYLTTLDASSHEFALHVKSTDVDCDFLTAQDTTSGNFLMVVDLGPDY